MAPILKKATATFCIRISSGHSMKSFLCKQMHLAFENDILQYGQDATIVALCIFHGHWTIWTLFKDGASSSAAIKQREDCKNRKFILKRLSVLKL